MEAMVRRRSLMLDTLAFSKGEIFMLMVLAVYSLEKARRMEKAKLGRKSGSRLELR